jgi:hypothetical protein
MQGPLLNQTSGLSFKKGALLSFYKQLRFQYFWDMTLNLPMLRDNSMQYRTVGERVTQWRGVISQQNGQLNPRFADLLQHSYEGTAKEASSVFLVPFAKAHAFECRSSWLPRASVTGFHLLAIHISHTVQTASRTASTAHTLS